MGKHKQYEFKIGSVFNNYTIVGTPQHNEHNERKYPTKCKCGREYMMRRDQLITKVQRDTHFCRGCASEYRRGKTVRRSSAQKSFEQDVPEVGKLWLAGKL